MQAQPTIYSLSSILTYVAQPQNNLVSHMPATAPRGIINNGSTCYIAAALQLLFHGLPSLVTWVLSPQFPRTANSDLYWHELRRLLAKLHFGATTLDNNNGGPIDASSFYQVILNWNGDEISEEKEGDAVSILNLILRELVGAESNNNNLDENKEGTGALKSIRGSYIQTIRTYDANSCEVETRSKERLFCGCPFPLTILGRGDSLEEVLHANTQAAQQVSLATATAVVDGENDNVTTRMEKTMQFKELPQHLLLHLKRFDYDKEEGVKKVLQPMDVPMKLNMEPFLYSDNDDLEKDNNNYECSYYELKGAIVHAGRDATHGHYICYIRANHQWILIDDDAVRAMSADEVCSILSGRGNNNYEGDDVPQSTMFLLYHQIQIGGGNDDDVFDSMSMDEVLFAHGLTDDAELVQTLLQHYTDQSFVATACKDRTEEVERKIASLVWLDLIPRGQWDNLTSASQLILQTNGSRFFGFFQDVSDLALCEALIALVDNQVSQKNLAELLEVLVSKSTCTVDNLLHAFKAFLQATQKLALDEENYEAADVGVKMSCSIVKGIYVTAEWLSYLVNIVSDDDFMMYVKANHHVEMLTVFRHCFQGKENPIFDENFCLFLQSLVRNRRSRSDVIKFISEIELEHGRKLYLSEQLLHLNCRKMLLCLVDIDDELRPYRIKCVVKNVIERSSIEEKHELPILVMRLFKRWHIADFLRSDTNLRQQFLDFVSCELNEEHLSPHYKLFTAPSSSKGEYEEYRCYDSDDDPCDILNKRISIRWAKGKWYDGVISDYDDNNGKHTVIYDDGDERRYSLKKKRIKFP